MTWNPRLERGVVLTAKQVNEVFNCSWSSGMNRSHKTNSLVLFSDHIKPLYNDRWGMPQLDKLKTHSRSNFTGLSNLENSVRVSAMWQTTDAGKNAQ